MTTRDLDSLLSGDPQRGDSADIQSALRADPDGFAFRCELSLEPLIAFWTQTLAAEGAAKAALARIVREALHSAPELAGTIADASVIERHRDLVDILMAAVFPRAAWEQDVGAAMFPFQLRGFYATPLMQRLMMGDDGAVQARVNLDAPMVAAMRMGYAYALVLRRLYGIEVEVDYPLICTVSDPATGLERHFRVLFDWRFEDVVPIGELPHLTDEVRERLHSNLLDTAWLRRVLPPERFVIRGFTIFRALEVTDQEVLSGLKRDLIDRESIVSNERFLRLQERLRTLFRRPRLLLGLAAIDGDHVLMLNYGARHDNACIFADSAHYRTSDFDGSVFARVVSEGRPLILRDIAALPERTPMEEDAVRSGIRNKLIAPLHYQGRVIGVLSLGSPEPGDLDANHVPKLHEVLPLFSMAVQRSLEELNARVEARIKEKFTAVQPVVEWRFRKAVLDGLDAHAEPGAIELEPIVFRDVHPLYALSDIRGSSTHRALAIQSDLVTQLRLARDVVRAAHQARALPALDELLYRIDKCMADVDAGLSAGDEVAVIAFLRAEVEAMFEHLRTFGAAVQACIDAYRAALDPQRGVVYRRRQVFEESVTRLIEAISAVLDAEDQAAQRMYPHYFEKQKTDGVDHQIYVGASLVEDGAFDPLYLKNLRLWQLMVVCGIAARADQLAAQLPVPLETTHLILVQHAPLSIRFRFDEKRFDVDGAYDIRYEIVKKRIDKALVRGSNERVTQPGKIAIVYSQPEEAAEYRSYIEYLQHQGYLSASVEELELGDLQGVHGLRALRVAVAVPAAPFKTPIALRALERAAPRC
jgi:hypothetical protein